jgi:GTP-binding protein
MKIAIVGRPNVGKSALFNRICKKRIAIVDEEEGITRDRLYASVYFFGKEFQIIDSGGIAFGSTRAFDSEIKEQTDLAIKEADVLIMVVDGQIGLQPMDKKVAELIFKSKKRIVLAVNKIDDNHLEHLIAPFYALGIEDIVGVSAEHGYHIEDLLSLATQGYRRKKEAKSSNNFAKIAIVGKPNVGKSTLMNFLLKEKRVAVSDIAGTTLDAVDVKITYGQKDYLLIDTAGIKRKAKEHNTKDKFAHIRTTDTIKRADLCILLMDSLKGMTVEDKKILQEIEDSKRAAILLFNKWDLVKGFRMEHCYKAVKKDAKFFPIYFVSAKTGRNLDNLFSIIDSVLQEYKKEISTSALNKFIEEAINSYHPPMIQGKRLRIYYGTQVRKEPPCFKLFTNYPELMQDSYKQYLLNRFREKFGFVGVPILFDVCKKTKKF